MAGLLFVGFDIHKALSGYITTAPAAPNTTSATQWPNVFCRPKGVYHNKGAATQDATIAPPADCSTPASFGFLHAGRVAGGGYGPPNGGAGYTAGSSTTRATWVTAQGHQLAANRSELGIGAEVWMTMDMAVQAPNSTLASSYLPTNTWAALFRFGDIAIYFKQQTLSGTLTIVFSINNNGVEVATQSTAGVVPGDWLFIKIHAKLDATTGLIEMVVNNVAQSVAYTNQNTVVTTSLAAATSVFFGPAVADNGTTAYVWFMDNVYLDDAAWPAGRINVATFALLADDTLSNFAAVGTSPTTVVNAISDPTDAKAGRASTSTGSAILTQTPPTTTSYLTDVIGIEIAAKRASNRDPANDRRLEIGYSLAGVQTMGAKSKATVLPIGVAVTPPEATATSTHTVEQIFTTSAAAKMTKTELATMKIVLKSAAP